MCCVARLVPTQDTSPSGGQSSVTGLKLQLGTETIQCSAYVKGEPVGNGGNQAMLAANRLTSWS